MASVMRGRLSCAVRNPFLTGIVETARVSTYGTDHKKRRPRKRGRLFCCNLNESFIAWRRL